MAHDKGGATELIPQAMREALDSFVAPSVRDSLLKSALEASALTQLPTRADELRALIDGSLRDALVRTLGPELAESVSSELERVAELVTVRPTASPTPDTERPRTDSPLLNLRAIASAPPRSSATQRSSPSLVKRRATPRPTLRRSVAPPVSVAHAEQLDSLPDSERDGVPSSPYSSTIPAGRRAPAQPPSSMHYPRGTATKLGIAPPTEGSEGADSSTRRLPFVLVATQDTNLVRRLSAWLDPRAAVLRVRSASSLLHDLENARDARSVIVLDCTQPSIRPMALAALADDLPASTEVLLWGVTQEVEQQVRALLPARARWIVISASAQPKDVAARCAELVC